MSKKSTSRTGSDGDAVYGSTNSRSSSSEGSKCNSCPHLSHKEEEATGPSGDYSSTHKILTPNLDDTRKNHLVQSLTLKKTFNTSNNSRSSLDEDLYGTSDAYNKNLEILRRKLGFLELTNSDTASHQETHRRLDLSAFDNKNSCGSSRKASNQEKPMGYLSIRETCLNLSSPFEKREKLKISPNSVDSNKSVIRTIYEDSEFYESANTTSTDSFRVPRKKVCLRGSTCTFDALPSRSSNISLTTSPKNLNLNRGLSEDSADSSKSSAKSSALSFPKVLLTPLPEHSTLITQKNVEILEAKNMESPVSPKPTTLSSRTGTSVNYVVPMKRMCIRESTPKNFSVSKISATTSRTSGRSPSSFSRTVCTQCSDLGNLKPPSEGEDNPALTSNDSCSESNDLTQRTKSVSLISSEVIELGLNLPSSIMGDYTSSSKTSPLEPNIIIIDTSYRKTEKFKKRNRIAPVSESSTSTPSSVISVCSSGDHRKNLNSCSSDKQEAYLYKKYYGDTSDVSSNPNSTPPCRISTGCSKTSSFPKSSTSEISKNSVRFVSDQKSKGDSLDIPVSPQILKPEVFNPLLNSSLEIPKVARETYQFPAISRITNFLGSFMGQPHAGDGSDDECKNVSLKGEELFSAKAEILLNSSRLSSCRKKSETAQEITADCCDIPSFTVTEESSSTLEIDNVSPGESFFKNRISHRKTQSTEMSFYSIPSHITLYEERTSRNSTANGSCSGRNPTAEEGCNNCCCFNIFFSKRRRGFFT